MISVRPIPAWPRFLNPHLGTGCSVKGHSPDHLSASLMATSISHFVLSGCTLGSVR